MEYYETFSAEEPSLGLNCTIGGKKYEFLLMSRQDYENYDLWLHQPKSPATPVAALLAEQGFAIDGGFLSKALERHELRSAILDLDAALVHVVAQKVA
ncbi:hypothetical protein [Rhizobium leguminosarum]|nr:hypothetical protein [Rhizobium leguminosarum]UIK18305.1 hypothetical protein LZK79_04505 [Rhizobium leguminosarum]